MNKKPRIIDRITQKLEECKLNKPRYKIENLHVGKIIYITNTEFYSSPTFWQCGTKITYKNIKPFAIFKHTCFDSDYLHIVTNHPLRLSLYGEIGEYCVFCDSLKDFDKCMQKYMIKKNLKKTSKLSINQIKELEDYVNQQLYPDYPKNELFCGK